MKSLKLFAVALFSTLVLAGAARADDAEAENLFKQANELYANRGDLAAFDGIFKVLDQAVATAEEDDLKYSIIILKARSLYWKGVNTDGKDAKLALFVAGYETADEARKLDDYYAEAYYYYGINLARWGETYGFPDSFFKRNELKDKMDKTLSHKQMDGTIGETIDGYGPDRVLGKMHHVLKALPGWNRADSLKLLKTSYTKGTDNALNAVYYAEVLIAGDKTEKKLGCSILTELLSKDPERFNPDRIPETRMDFKVAQKMKADNCR